VRLLQHINGSTNTHLKHALTLYSLEAFEFLVVEFVTNTVLLAAREQEYLDWLFSLSEDLRYNFCAIAGSTFGYTHTAETKALISERLSGENHPMFGKTHSAEAKAAIGAARLGTTHTAETKAAIGAARLGTTHTAETKAAISAAKLGKTHTAESNDQNRLNQPNRMSVFVYDLNNKLLGEFLSQHEAAKFLKCDVSSISRNVNSGKRFRKIYLITTGPLP
jgi:group I intron endonuclease